MTQPAFSPSPEDNNSERAAIFAKFKEELLQVAQQADGLQSFVGDVVRRSGLHSDPQVLAKAQGIDRLVQRLYALVDYAGAMGGETPGAALRASMSGAVSFPPRATMQDGLDIEAEGDVELF